MAMPVARAVARRRVSQETSIQRNDTSRQPVVAWAGSGQTPAAVDSAIRAAVAQRGFVWLVVGDAAKVRPQLAKLGMPIEVVSAR